MANKSTLFLPLVFVSRWAEPSAIMDRTTKNELRPSNANERRSEVDVYVRGASSPEYGLGVAVTPVIVNLTSQLLSFYAATTLKLNASIAANSAVVVVLELSFHLHQQALCYSSHCLTGDLSFPLHRIAVQASRAVIFFFASEKSSDLFASGIGMCTFVHVHINTIRDESKAWTGGRRKEHHAHEIDRHQCNLVGNNGSPCIRRVRGDGNGGSTGIWIVGSGGNGGTAEI
uniref:Uncharacterized protein n=1 Tax=Oryza nivara TaxID=4536 RepID=A0A0E0FIW5_ORYNI